MSEVPRSLPVPRVKRFGFDVASCSRYFPDSPSSDELEMHEISNYVVQ